MFFSLKKVIIASLFSSTWLLSNLQTNLAMDPLQKKSESINIKSDLGRVEVKSMNKLTEEEIKRISESFSSVFTDGPIFMNPKNLYRVSQSANGCFNKARIFMYIIKNPFTKKEKVVSYAVIINYDNKDEESCTLIKFWTKPEEQRKGYGEKLLRWIINYNFTHESKNIKLIATPAGAKLYNKCLIPTEDNCSLTPSFRFPTKEEYNKMNLNG